MKDYTDGYVQFKGYKTYYKTFGPEVAKGVPLLVVHGGPGSSHNYLLGLSDLATDRKVVFYDQLGGGLSDKSTDDSIWNFELFLDELKTVREALGLKEIHLLGHSWGGMLAIEYLLQEQSGIKSAVLASSMVSMPMYQREVEKLKMDLPKAVYETLVAHERAGTANSEAYKEAMKVYNKRHIYRGKVYPESLEAPEGSFCTASYEKLWGVSEAYADGELKDWDRTSRLGEIRVPTLITSGQYDELTPQQAVTTHDLIPGSQLKIFTAASHLAHIEHAREYVQTIADFLHDVEPRKS